MTSEALKLVEELNMNCWDRLVHVHHGDHRVAEETANPFSYSSDGNEASIEFAGAIIWSTVDDIREWDENAVVQVPPLKEYVLEETRKLVQRHLQALGMMVEVRSEDSLTITKSNGEETA